MVREKSEGLYVTVPSFFRCPISMDLMKSPVSLCTGVTYDRSSIQTWLAQGHNTCPATMQVLPSTDFVPNLTLRRLIRLWSESDSLRLLSSPVSEKQVTDSIKNMIENKNDTLLDSLSKVVEFTKYSDENRKFLANFDAFIPTIVGVMSNVDVIGVCESIITVLDLIISESGVKEQVNKLMFKNNRDCLSPFVLVLQKGSINSKIESAKVLESIAFDAESQRTITDKNGLLYELYRLVSSETDRFAMEAGLSALIALTTTRPVGKELVRFGIVRTVGKILAGTDAALVPVMEKAMTLLELVSTCTEGRTAISEDERCVTAVVQRLMKVSSAATEHGVVVLWSVCCLARDGAAREVAMRNNGLTKVLLVMQSDRTGSVRQMCADLVKAFRVNSKSCLASYETKTTHIMPY